MASKPFKITSEIAQSCNKLISSRAYSSVNSKLPEILGSRRDQFRSDPPFRYTIANTDKPSKLPELNFKDETTTQFSDLQPSASPEFRFCYTPPKWAEKPTNSSPFPATINSKSRRHVIYTDQQKAEEKMMKFRMSHFNPMIRHFSTNYMRSYSSASDKCTKKIKRCKTAKKKNCKPPPHTECPRLKLLECKQSPGSNCKLSYMDPHCAKKFAPYPSYSETCAENLPDDPSECQQCPWRTCDDADSIEPGNPVRHKRNYSTSCWKHLDATAGVVTGPLLPTTEVQNLLCKHPCGNVKQPCKQPPGPCEVRREKEEQKKRDKEIKIPKKALKDLNRMVLRSALFKGGEDLSINPHIIESLRLTMDDPSVVNKSSWIDIIKNEEMFLDKKQKHPNCHRKKKPKRPFQNYVDESVKPRCTKPTNRKPRSHPDFN